MVFDRPVTDEFGVAAPDAPPVARRRRPGRWVWGAVAAVGVLLLTLVWVRARGSSAGAAGTPHFVDEAVAAGIDHRYQGDASYYVGGGVAAFDCNGDGREDLYFAGGSAPAGAVSEHERDQRRAPIRAGAVTGHGPDCGDRRLPARCRQRRRHRHRRAAQRGRQRRSARARRLPVRGRRRPLRPGRRERLDSRVQRDLGGHECVADVRVRQLPRPRDVRLRLERAGATRVRRALWPAGRAVAWVLQPVGAVQRLGPLGPARPADGERPQLLPRRQ